MCIIESKPDNVAADLRLGDPWPELQQFADSLDLNTVENIVHKHIPYGVPSLHCQVERLNCVWGH